MKSNIIDLIHQPSQNSGARFVPLFVFVVLGAVSVDRVTKIMYQHFAPTSISINRGLSFNIILPNILIIALLLLSTIIVVALIPKALRRLSKRNVVLFAMALGGAASNIYDRIVFGGVLDVFHIWISWFNLADVFLISGTLVIILQFFPHRRAE